MKMVKAIVVVTIALACFTPVSSQAAACEELSAFSENISLYSVDYLPRICFADPAETEACVIELPPYGVAAQFPIYAYNLGEGIKTAELRITAYGEITQFDVGPGWFNLPVLVDPIGPYTTADISVGSHAAVCGPVLLGVIHVMANPDANDINVELSGFGGTDSPIVVMGDGSTLPTRDPFHGAYAGSTDLYHCQPSLCVEPLPSIVDLAVVEDGGALIRLNWTAGDGSHTMIRYRNDGVHPQSIFDGELLVLLPTFAGSTGEAVYSNIEQDYYQFYSTAFNVDAAGEDVINGSILDCGAYAYGELDPSIPNEMTTWGAIKQQYR
jgi:hypothetical protein